MAEPQGEGDAMARSLRARQDRDIAMTHALTSAEYALASEAAQVARAFAVVGLRFDAQTFVAMRILESGVAEDLDLEHALSSSVIRGLIDRSAALSAELLAS
jgi:hypothetical protein